MINRILIWLMMAQACFAGSYYKVSIVVTSVPPANAGISADGDLRGWQAAGSITNAQKQIATTNTLQAATTNLYTHLGLYGFTNVNGLKLGTNGAGAPTNTIVLETAADHLVTVTTLSNWATITYSTQATVSGWVAVRVPHTNETPTVQTQVVNGVVGIIGDPNATNKVPATAPALGNFLNLSTNAQTGTNKSFTGGNWSGGLTNAIAGGAGGTSQTAKVFYTNAWIVTDGTRTWGIQTASGTKFYFSSVATNAQDVLTVGSLVLPWFDTNAGGFFWVSNNTDYVPARMDVRVSPTPVVGNLTVSNGTLRGYTYVETNSAIVTADTDWGYEFKSATEGFSIYTPVQYGTLNRNQFAWNSNEVESVSIKTAAAVTNITYYGNTTNSGHTIEASVSQSGLAAGPNIITVLNGDRQRLQATGGAASIIGITNSARGPANGDVVTLENGTGYALTLVNESGSEPITVDRLRTVNQVSNVVVQPGGFALLKWDAVPGRWAVLYPEQLSATQITNAVAPYVGAVIAEATNTVTTNMTPALPPIGAVIAWLKTLTNTLTLSSNWVECNGQILTNLESPLHLATIPNLNGANRFLRGNSTSGTTNGAATHTHGFTTQTTDQPSAVVHVAAGSDLYVGSETHVHGLSGAVTETGSSLPPSYDVVWVMRIR